MKKHLLLSLLIFFLGTFFMTAQVGCGSTFTDPAGPNANYANNSNSTTTICASNSTDYVTVTFTSFATESCCDYLSVYDGSDNSAPLLGNYHGSTIPDAISSSTPGGCLTFVFISDSSLNDQGWVANVTCSSSIPQPCNAPTGLSLLTNNTGLPSLTWNAGTANQWEVLELPAGTFPTATSVGVVVATNTYQIVGSSSSNNTVVFVRALCATNSLSNWSPSATISTPLCPAPTMLTANNITLTSANLGWTNTTNATSWQVAVQLSTVSTIPTTGTVVTGNSNYVATGLVQATSYNFYIRTDCGSGVYGSWSSPFSFATLATPLTAPVCGGIFTDNGGLTSYYQNNTDSTVTVYPTNPGEAVTVTFTSFDTETDFDGLYVYDGNSINVPQISSGNSAESVPGGLPGAFWGTNIPGPFTSSSPDGSLTFRFRSDSSINKAGWSANVTCDPAPTCSAPINAVVSAITTSNATLGWTTTGTASQWEVLVLPADSPPPSVTSTGTFVSSNSYQFSNLQFGTAYIAYVRSVCSTSDVSTWTGTSFSTLICQVNPLYLSSLGSSSAIIYYSNQNSNSFSSEIIVLPSGSPVPSATTSGILLTSNGYQVTGLTCGTAYIVYSRTNCNQVFTSWSSTLTFTTSGCVLTTGQPIDLSQCNNSTTQNCFNLEDNNALILANLNPLDYSLNYYGTFTDANSQQNPLVSPYCIANNSNQSIYAVLVNLATQQNQQFYFTISAQVVNTIVIPNMDQCDDNGDGSVVFNLTSQVTSSNPLSYYSTNADALSQTNAILNPSAYTISSSSAVITIYGRETMVGTCDNLYIFQIHAYSDCNLAHNCSQANSLCGELGIPFANTHQGISADSGNDYGCLYTTPNPTWFYLPVSNAGSINLTVEQNVDINFNSTFLDVDYIVYGPFADPVTPCSGSLTQSNIVSCSYSIYGIEHPVIPNAQVGQYYLLMTTNYSNQTGFIRITMDASSQGAINCSGIRLNAFLDSNNNGTQEVGEQNFPIGQFHYDVNNGNVHNITSPTGTYNIYDIDPTNSYDVSYTLDPAYVSMYGITTSSYSNLHVIAGTGITTYNFPVTSTQNYDDLAVSIVPYNSPRPGTTYKNKIVYTNLGSQTIATGTVTFNASSGTTITNISQSGTTTVANGFSYDFANLLPFETRVIIVTMMVPPIPSVTLGQLLTNSASINPTAGDILLSNNTASSTQAVIGSYDPNDKTESHGDRIVYSTFTSNDYLYYTIRFENTGAASAVDVRVNDILDSKLDETSIKMVAASNSYILDRVGSNLLWKFDNIQLPVSVPDSEIGKGFITFKVKMKPGFSSGDIVPNSASIYFDSNPVITTNTFTTQFVDFLNNMSFDTNEFSLYPNPASQTINIKLSNVSDKLSSITLFDVLGKTILTIENVSSNQLTVDVSHISSGVYFVEIKTENNMMKVKKLVIQ